MRRLIALVLLSSGCVATSHQIGFLSPALPLDPDGPVEVGGSIGGFGRPLVEGEEEIAAESQTLFLAWDVHGTAHVRVPLSWGTSMRVAGGVGRDSTTFAVSFLHAFGAKTPEKRFQGSFMWGVGHRMSGLGLGYLGSGNEIFLGHHGLHFGVQLVGAMTDHMSWQGGMLVHNNLVTVGRDDDTRRLGGGFLPILEASLLTGPVFYAHGPKGTASTFFMTEFGVRSPPAVVGLGVVPSPAFVVQLSIGRTQRPRHVSSRAVPEPDALGDDE